MSLPFRNSITWIIYVVAVVNFSQWEINAIPAPATSHIVSYVHQKKLKEKYDKFPNFDFEFDEVRAVQPNQMQRLQDGRGQKKSERLVQHLNINMNTNHIDDNNAWNGTTKRTDDLMTDRQNTLDNSTEIFGNNQQHEMPIRNSSSTHNNTQNEWNRAKQSIPVLEPVKHLLNTVREGGGFNHTAHANRNTPHHQLVGAHHHNNSSDGAHPMTESSAIETEEEREMELESNDFKFLEVIGSLGGRIWGFFTNIQKAFAASSGSASAASSSSSSSLSGSRK